MITKKQAIHEELEGIRANAGGVLRAEHVVEFARDPETALHSEFEWDDAKAAHEARLMRARHVIRAVVNVIKPPQRKPVAVRAYMSLADERGGGYRAVGEVMSDAGLREAARQQLLREIAGMHRRYRQFTEISALFERMMEVLAA